MLPQRNQPDSDQPAGAILVQPSSPRYPTNAFHRKIGIAVDLSDESAYAVTWAVQNYLRRPGDSVILLHVSPTSVLYGADWGSIELSLNDDDDPDAESQQQLEDQFDTLTTAKANDLAKPLVEAQFPFKIHIVKDHDMKERLCLEVERLGLSAVIMGSRGFGASRRADKGRLGSVSDYCVHHCVCPVIVVRYPEDKDAAASNGFGGGHSKGAVKKEGHSRPPAAEEEAEYHDASDKHTEMGKDS